MNGRVLALVAALLTPAAAAAQEGVDAILGGLGLAPSAEIVVVRAALRADGQVVVTLTPDAGAKLVADPGVNVVPVDPAGLPVGEPVALSDGAADYFSLPPSLAVRPGQASALRVGYAYCVVAKQCLFGEVTLPVPPGS